MQPRGRLARLQASVAQPSLSVQQERESSPVQPAVPASVEARRPGRRVKAVANAKPRPTRPPRPRPPGLEAIKDADLLIIYVRMRIPPKEQLELLR